MVCHAAAPASSNLTAKEAEELAADIKKLEDRESWWGKGQHAWRTVLSMRCHSLVQL